MGAIRKRYLHFSVAMLGRLAAASGAMVNLNLAWIGARGLFEHHYPILSGGFITGSCLSGGVLCLLAALRRSGASQ